MLIRSRGLKRRRLGRHIAVARASTKSIHPPARSLRRKTSLLPSLPASADIGPETSRSIKPRELDLRDLHLFFLTRIFTRPTSHPRHATRISDNKSKPVRPLQQRNHSIRFRRGQRGFGSPQTKTSARPSAARGKLKMAAGPRCGLLPEEGCRAFPAPRPRLYARRS